jgi:hypothetical protein
VVRRLDIVSLVCFALAAASLSIFTIVNLDMGFHLRAGELIWETGRIPTQDIFSYVAEGRRWVDSQWLFQTVIYGAHALAGNAGLVVVRALIVGALIGALFAASHRSGFSAITLALGLLAVFACLERFTLRPDLFTMAFLAVFVAGSERFERHPRFWLVTLPMLQVIWTNTHALHVLGPLYLGAGLAGRMIDTQLRRLGARVAAPAEGARELRQRIVLVLLCSLAVLFNANGVDGMLYPFQLYRELQGEVSWFPPVYELMPTLERELQTALSPLVFFRVLVVLSVLAMAACWRSLRLGDLLPYAVFLYLSLEAVRNVPLFVIVAPPIAARCLRELVDRLPGRRHPSAGAIAIGTALGMIAVTGCIVVGTTSGALYRHLGWQRSFGIGDSRELPSSEIVNRLRGVEGRILNDPNLGGFLIWRLYPEKQVAVDGRWEVYGELLPGVRKVFHDRTAFLRFASGYGVDAVVVRKRSGVARLTPHMMRSIPDFRLTLETPNTLLYERVPKNPPATNGASESAAAVGTEEADTDLQP